MLIPTIFCPIVYNVMILYKSLKIILRCFVYYLLGCGLFINLLAIDLYFYERTIFYKIYDKTEEEIQLTLNPNALIEREKYLKTRLGNAIAINFGQWQPLPGSPSVPLQHIKIGGNIYNSMLAASTALQDGQSMMIGEGIYHEPLIVRSSNVQIIGSGHVVFDGAAAEGKAAIVTKGQQISISNIECKNIAVADHNGACVRSEGVGLTLNHVYFHDSEQGILSSGNKHLEITNSRFEKLGKNGFAHGIYIDAGEVLIDSSLFLASVSQGHEIKSRASKTVIKNSTVASLSAEDSRLLDISNGGILVIENSVLEKGPESSNDAAIGYGLEGITHNQNTITLKKNVIILERDRYNILLDTKANQAVSVNAIGNVIISKDNIDMDGLNWLFANRQEAKIEKYPKLPVLEQIQQPEN
ncbi:MAG: hypothetical protein PHU14_15675 [Methylovulum sp.]|nr:hypothetical protein [Methylovulum sp.]